jgi:hypothetical protein
MRSVNATNFHRKSGGAQPRDLQFREPLLEMFFDRAQWRDLRFLLTALTQTSKGQLVCWVYVRPISILGRTRLAFARRIPGLKSETWATLRVFNLKKCGVS